MSVCNLKSLSKTLELFLTAQVYYNNTYSFLLRLVIINACIHRSCAAKNYEFAFFRLCKGQGLLVKHKYFEYIFKIKSICLSSRLKIGKQIMSFLYY